MHRKIKLALKKNLIDRLLMTLMTVAILFMFCCLKFSVQRVYASDGMTIADVTDGETANPVAAIGHTGYATLQAAINAADNKTVTLLQNISDVEVTIANDKSVILDLNGKTLTGVSRTGCVNTITNKGSLTINGAGTIQTAGDVGGCVEWFRVIYNEGTLVINGGTYITNCGHYIENHGYICALYNASGNMTINGGQIEYTWPYIDAPSNNYSDTIYISAGTLTINGGTIKRSGAQTNYPIYRAGGTVSIKGGTIIGNSLNLSKCVTGGKFSFNPSSYVVDGYSAAEANSEWSVRHATGTLNYTADGATLSVSCTDANHASHTASLTLVATGNFRNFESEGMIGWKTGNIVGFKLTGQDTWKSVLGEVDIPNIYYEGTGSTTFAKSTTKPTEPGTYKATITVDEKTASVNFIIKTLYTVNFNANGGFGTMTSAEVPEGQYTLPLCLIKPPMNKEFDGWALSASGSKISTLTTNVSGNMTLYAKWMNHVHSLSTAEISEGVTKKSCACGFYIIIFD